MFEQVSSNTIWFVHIACHTVWEADRIIQSHGRSLQSWAVPFDYHSNLFSNAVLSRWCAITHQLDVWKILNETLPDSMEWSRWLHSLAIRIARSSLFRLFTVESCEKPTLRVEHWNHYCGHNRSYSMCCRRYSGNTCCLCKCMSLSVSPVWRMHELIVAGESPFEQFLTLHMNYILVNKMIAEVYFFSLVLIL